MNDNFLQESQSELCDIIEKYEVLILIDKKNVSVEYTTKCLIDVCEHYPLQARQCAIMSKMKGNCDIASGSHEELVAKRDKLLALGLNAKMAR